MLRQMLNIYAFCFLICDVILILFTCLLIGLTVEGLTDFGPTPIEPIEANLFIHANALNTILSDDYIK